MQISPGKSFNTTVVKNIKNKDNVDKSANKKRHTHKHSEHTKKTIKTITKNISKKEADKSA